MSNHPLSIKAEPDFERLRTALFGGQPDRVPLLELAIADNIKAKYLGRPVRTLKDQIDFYRLAGYDYVKISPIFNMNPDNIKPKEGDRISSPTENTAQRQWHATSAGIITTLAEFEKFRWPLPHEIDYSQFETAQNLLPDNMKIICQYGDIFTWTWDFMGFETFSFAIIDNPELVALMFDKIGCIVYDVFKECLEFDNIGALFYSDDLAINTGPFISPSIFRTYLFPWMKKIGALCQQKNIPFIFHSDGNIWQLMDDLKQCGINTLQPLEPQAIDIVEVKQKRGKDFGLAGNVDVDLLTRGSREQVETEVKRLLKLVAPGGGYCLGSGNTVADYVNYENYFTMIETAKRFGQYPIDTSRL